MLTETGTVNKLDHVTYLLKSSNDFPYVLGKNSQLCDGPVRPYGI